MVPFCSHEKFPFERSEKRSARGAEDSPFHQLNRQAEVTLRLPELMNHRLADEGVRRPDESVPLFPARRRRKFFCSFDKFLR